MSGDASPRTALAWPETRWYAYCPHCDAQNEVDADACESGAAHEQTCSVCHKNFSYRNGT